MKTISAIAHVVLLEMVRRKDFYVLFILTFLITVLAGSVSFFNDDRIVRYLKEICLLLIWISTLVIAVTCAARQFPAEQESRTIYPLLAKPVSRDQLILGKFAGCWVATLLALFLFYFFLWALSGLKNDPLSLLHYLQALVLHAAGMSIVISFVLMGSFLFAAPSSNTTISLIAAFGILMLGRHLNKVALQQPEPIQTIFYMGYYLLPHLEWFDIRALLIHNWEPAPWGIVLLAILYATAYSAIFLGAACVLFRKRRLA